MAYSDFKKLEEVKSAFSLLVEDTVNLFETVNAVKPSDLLDQFLERYTSLALAINTEKARSEFIIAPILAEIREILKGQISLFSGVDFNVDPEKRLTGRCDFIISRARQQHLIEAPVITIVEAEKGDLQAGLGQCIAAMLGAHIFNERAKNEVKATYGVVTTGENWEFLKLEEKTIFIDSRIYYLNELEHILGILVHMVS